jgi:DNA helicase II / ATP-dependent DNA helicase PcrA
MPPDVLADLDPEQRQAAEALGGPVCILAGAGTGKTRAITHRTAHMVHAGVAAPAQILAVTFTTRAAGEMRARLRALGVGGVQARTFHSAALRQLQYFWPRISSGGRPTIVESKLPTIRAAATRLRLSLDPATQRDLAAEIEWAKAALVGPDGYTEAAGRAGRTPPFETVTVAKLYGAYEDINSDRGQLDFEDLLLLTAAAIEEHPAIAHEVRAQYRHFVVDEYQDVNPLQQRLLDAWLADRTDLCVVGDPNQTIYSFTGASPSYLLEFPSRYPDSAVVRLVRDYRSTNQVVALANRLLRGQSQLQAQCGDGPEPTFAEYDDEPAEAQGAVRQVQALADAGVPLSEIAILYRINAQSEVYEAALADAGIAYQLRGGERFFDRPEVRQGVVLLRASTRAATDDVSEMPLPAAAAEVLRAAGLTPEPPAARGATREKWDSLRALAGLAEEMAAASPDATMEMFVEELAQRMDAQHAPVVEGVTLATLHAAKGLEWDAVFLVGLVDGTLPITHATTPEQVAEERRLLYVGMTRARRHLSLSWAQARAAGGRRSRKPSRFLDGLRPAPLAGERARAASTAKRVKPADSVRPEDAELFEALRDWRRTAAEAAGMPPYIVFSDRTLVDIVTARPVSASALSAVPGVGPKKLELYAADILRIITDHPSG